MHLIKKYLKFIVGKHHAASYFVRFNSYFALGMFLFVNSLIIIVLDIYKIK